MAHFERVIVLIDMDCFYCQVEEQLNPAIAGKPVAVIQYSAWQAGGYEHISQYHILNVFNK